jgi:hypothetical protein
MTVPKETKSSHGATPCPTKITRGNLNIEITLHLFPLKIQHGQCVLQGFELHSKNNAPNICKIKIARDYLFHGFMHGYNTSPLEWDVVLTNQDI